MNAVPAWIAMAKVKQRENEEKEEGLLKEEEETSEETQPEDVKAENLVKPSALKAKPTLLPKPTAPPKPDISSPPPMSPPTAARPDITQRPTLRFNAKTDLPKDVCVVCKKTAYVLERMEVNKRTLHRSCAKCYLCSRTLSLGDIFIQDEKVWCK